MNSELNPSQQVRKRHSPWRGLIVLAVMVSAAAAVYLYGPSVVDAARAAQFKPSDSVSLITKRMSLTDRGKHIFYATSPQVESRVEFNRDCQSAERTAAILGCYTTDRIYLYDIQDPELAGASETTAAHELLHAAYSRLNVFDRDAVDKMINIEYQKLKHDPQIVEMMAYYAKAEPGQETNELHSVIGTTVKDLPPELESYYARYFTDRAAIVDMNTQYTAVFRKLSQQASDLQAKITTEAAEIKSDRRSYDDDLARLNEDIQTFNQNAKSGSFSSQYSFNQARGVLLARVSEMTNRQEDLNAKVDTYNKDVAEYNKLAIRSKELNEGINGVQAPDSI